MSEVEPQVSWKAIEPDAVVVSSDGQRAGAFSRIVGDPDADVFTGLAIVIDRLGGERFVAAERVRGIWPNRVELDLTADEIGGLPKHEETPSVRWRPDTGVSGFFRRFLGRGRP